MGTITGAMPPTEPITVTTNLNSEPAHAEQLGHICVAWANLEWNMYTLFELMCGGPPALARATFYSIESNRGKRDALSAVGQRLFHKTSEASILDDIIRRIGTSGKQRNKYVHDTWGVTNTTAHEIFQMRLGNLEEDRDMEEVTIPDMKNAIEQITKLTNEIWDFSERIKQRVPALLETLRARPSIALQFAKKGHPPGRKPKGHHGQR